MPLYIADLFRQPLPLDRFLRSASLRWFAPLGLLATVLAGYSLYLVDQQRTATVRVSTEHLAMEIDANLRVRLHGLEAVVGAVRRKAEQTTLQDWYDQARAYDVTFDAPVVLIDTERRQLFNTRRPLGEFLPPIPTPPKRSSIDEALDSGQPRVGDVIRGRVLQRNTVPVVVPFLGPSQAQMLLLGQIFTDSIADLLLQQKMPEGYQAAVFDSAGQLIASTGEPPPMMNHPSSSRRKTTATTVAPFTVVVEADRTSFYRPHATVVAGLMLLIGGTFLLAVRGSRRISAGLVNAVRELVPSVDGRSNASIELPRITEIQAARAEISRISEAVREAETAERARLASELHDGLQQDVAAALLHIAAALRTTTEGTQAQLALSEVQTDLQRVSREIRQIAHALRPDALSGGSLVEALTQLTDKFSEVAQVHTELEFVGVEAEFDGLPEPVSDALYRVIQEALNNVRKHAQASFVHVEMELSDARRVVVNIRDDGIGFTHNPSRSGLGMLTMAQRVHNLNGTLNVRSRHNEPDEQGTTVTADVPLT